jgi:ATP-dependent HslUV protease subunit HslV
MEFHATTIIGVLRHGKLALAGDGQVTLNNTIVKRGATKIRRISLPGNRAVLAGFAGSAADAFTLFERFDAKLHEYGGQLTRAAVELARDWRNDRFLRRLEALMIVGDPSGLFVLSGGGDVIQPDDGMAGIGSGGTFALAAARGIVRVPGADLSAVEVARMSLEIASGICPFTNDVIAVEEV